MGFPAAFTRWISACIQSARFSCSANGAASSYFTSHKGIRQGDPLSPYLFIIFQQLFTNIVTQFVQQGKLQPFRYKNFEVSHLLFADDIIITAKASRNSVQAIKEALQLFSDISGQTINHAKSKLYFPGQCSAAWKTEVATSLNIQEGPLPITYLGSFISSSKLPSMYQHRIVNKVLDQFHSWASSRVSQAGRIVQINAITNSMPIHSLATSWVDEKVIKRIQGLSSEFFWRNTSSGQSFRLISWKKMTRSKHHGGLGIKDLRIVKRSLRAKRLLLLFK